MTHIFSIMLGGALGSLSRYFVSSWLYEWLGRSFPIGTLGVNVVGSLLMGFLSVYLVDKWPVDPAIKMGVLVGFLGAFTTFSTFSLETLHLIQNTDYLKALLNMLVSVVLCVLAVAVGMFLAQSLNK